MPRPTPKRANIVAVIGHPSGGRVAFLDGNWIPCLRSKRIIYEGHRRVDSMRKLDYAPPEDLIVAQNPTSSMKIENGLSGLYR